MQPSVAIAQTVFVPPPPPVVRTGPPRCKRSREGYLLIDHRAGPGLSIADAAAAGLPGECERRLYESATYTCSHCCRVVVLNPQRTRAREYCSKCDHHICDGCAAAMSVSGECQTFQQLMDEVCQAASAAA